MRASFFLVTIICVASACDSTPRERQEIMRQEARKLDTVADKAAAKLRTAGRRTVDYGTAARARKNQPLNVAAEASLQKELLGTYSDLSTITPTNVAAAYTQFMRQVRAKRRTWTQRDWDYADAIFKRLNERRRAIYLDVRASDDVRVKALQAEYLTLENGRDVKDLGQAIKQ
jgi:cytochrome c oxidase assembly factor CtaG